jgi:hypothetical protein
MYSLSSVEVLSCAKITGALYGWLGLIFLPFLLLGGFGSLLFGQGSASSSSGIVMLLIAILAPIVYGVMGFVMGAFTAWVYNLVARRIGGIRLELKPMTRNRQSNVGLI